MKYDSVFLLLACVDVICASKLPSTHHELKLEGALKPSEIETEVEAQILNRNKRDFLYSAYSTPYATAYSYPYIASYSYPYTYSAPYVYHSTYYPNYYNSYVLG